MHDAVRWFKFKLKRPKKLSTALGDSLTHSLCHSHPALVQDFGLVEQMTDHLLHLVQHWSIRRRSIGGIPLPVTIATSVVASTSLSLCLLRESSVTAVRLFVEDLTLHLAVALEALC